MTSLNGATVLVTGANGGLGREFVRQTLDRGAAKVYATARRPEDGWGDSRVVPLRLDVTDAGSIAAAVDAAADVTVLVNNAGAAATTPSLLETPDAEVRHLFDTNAFGPLALAKAFVPALEAAEGGLLNVASVASWRSRPMLAAYGASKAALWSFTDSLRRELAPRGVQVTGLYVAFIDTPMTAGIDVPGKLDAGEIVRITLDGFEAGEPEVLADPYTRQVRRELAEPLSPTA